MARFVMNLGDNLVDFHSVGQNKVYAEKQHLKKFSKTNTYNILQQLTGRAPQQQLLVLCMTMVSCWKKSNSRNHLHVSILQLFSLCLKIRLKYSCLFFLVFGFKMYGVEIYVYILFFSDRSLPAAQEKSTLW